MGVVKGVTVKKTTTHLGIQLQHFVRSGVPRSDPFDLRLSHLDALLARILLHSQRSQHGLQVLHVTVCFRRFDFLCRLLAYL